MFITFRVSNFTNFLGGGGHAPGAPWEFVPPALNVHASGANGARPPAEPLHPVLPNATKNPDVIPPGKSLDLSVETNL